MAEKLSLTKRIKNSWNRRTTIRKIFDIVVGLFALAGFAIIGAWAFYMLGGTNNKGAEDKNYRYMMSVSEMESLQDSTITEQEVHQDWIDQYFKLAAFAKFYPANAKLITEAALQSDDPMIIDKMLAAASMYITDVDSGYSQFMQKLNEVIDQQEQQNNPTVIPWMNTVEWQALKEAIVNDSALINEAGRLTGVEPRMIVSCLIGEQIRLFNSKRETFKKYLGPMKVLSVQSQFSYGVNGIKNLTAIAVEEHLKDTASVFYMGTAYEHLLDFETEDHQTERYNRLVDYRNHLYSYIYTGCILHQTMLQWKRAGYDISDRPEILFTLFNIGFEQSEPKANPICGGSHITVNEQIYTFGAIGFDFYYSGEMADIFPYWKERFILSDGERLTNEEIADIQSNMSDCTRPSRYANPKKSANDNLDNLDDNTTFIPAISY